MAEVRNRALGGDQAGEYGKGGEGPREGELQPNLRPGMQQALFSN